MSISGGQKPAVRIRANPTLMASYGLNLEDLRNAIVAANVNQAKGNFDGPHQSYQIGANDQLLSSADYAPLVVAYRNGSPVKMTDVATVEDDVENIRQAAWMNDDPCRHREHSAPAGRQRHRRGGPHQGPARSAQEIPAILRQGHHSDRPDHHHSRLRCTTWSLS